ncbi:MAG: AmmeMemoRadiSam system protein B [Spirochaetales bacterium]|jgi:AmmeMemoRadiSam system protein B|nr:AmmeMemoRadiSam system protein B [Spirochaetales bacterium]
MREKNFILQKRCLSSGWYPDTEEGVRLFIEALEADSGSGEQPAGPRERTSRLCVVPHAGWFFSGSLAWQGISSLAPAGTVIVLGGHLPPGDTLMVYDCDAFETPLGQLVTDRALLEKLMAGLPCRADLARDNTVEVQLPFIKYAFPQAKVVGLRVPPSRAASSLGHFLTGLCTEADIVVAASTDLTHYGPNYAFTPKGAGPAAESWVKEENDAPFLEALAAMDYARVLKQGHEGRAACSSGAAAAAAVCAAGLSLSGHISGYATSLEKHRSPSFVGYGVVLYGACCA